MPVRGNCPARRWATSRSRGFVEAANASMRRRALSGSICHLLWELGDAVEMAVLLDVRMAQVLAILGRQDADHENVVGEGDDANRGTTDGPLGIRRLDARRLPQQRLAVHGDLRPLGVSATIGLSCAVAAH